MIYIGQENINSGIVCHAEDIYRVKSRGVIR